jgi:hypothetical protein
MTVGQVAAEYPVQVSITNERGINNLWGIPFLGHMARGIMAIPHLVVLALLGICIELWVLVGWIPILLYGRVPALAVRIVCEWMLRYQKVAGYVTLLMPGPYPPLEEGLPGPVALQVNLKTLEINQVWGIPIVGFVARIVAAIPHIVVLSILATVMWLTLIVLWIPILFTGRYPEWAAGYYRHVLRYMARVQAWILLLPVPYPPFVFD